MSKMMASATYSTPTESGDSGSVDISMMGMDMNMPLMKVNGKWFFDGDNAPMAQASQLPNASNLLKIASSVLEQIKSGQISDQAQLDAALQPIMKIMMGG